MKKVLLSFVSILFITTNWAQSVVVNSPAHLAGSYQFGTATAWGADLLSNIWTADAVLMIDDGTSMTDGCDNITNGADLAGKTVLVDRGSCNFSLKAKNAQDNGAISCIIFNNIPGGGVAAMGAGTFGADVTIPVVMLSYEDGVAIKAELANGPVNISIGNIKFDHDLGSNNRADICHAPMGTYPASWIRKNGDFSITPTAQILNKGRNVETGVSLNGKIEFTPRGGSPSIVSDKTSDASTVIEIDSTRGIALEATDLFGMIPANTPGQGRILYNISANDPDGSNFDNMPTSNFFLSENIISKARRLADGREPLATNSYRRADGTNAEYVTGFNLNYGMGCKIDSVLFYMSIAAPSTLAGLTPEAILYGWDDVDNDGNATNAEISFLALGTQTFDASDTRTGAVVRIPLEDFNTGDAGFMIPSDNFKVFVGIRYSGFELPFFGFDEGMNYLCDNNQRIAAGTITDVDLPYFGITGYDPNTGVPDVENAAFRFTGLDAGLTASLVMSGDCIVVGTKQLDNDEAKITAYPNPAKDLMNVNVTLKETSSRLIYTIMDNSGKVLYQLADRSSSDNYQARIHVQDFTNGLYHLQIRTDKGVKQTSFEVLK